MLSRALVAVLAIFVLSGCNQTQAVPAIDKLKPCTGDDTPVDAYCGTLKVYENRATKQGRQIDLNIVVLPALRADAQPDPLFFLAGGPGQGAAKLAKVVREIFRRVQTDRDIVLVDQRGTGKSNPLNCDNEDDSLKALTQTPNRRSTKLKKCQAEVRRRPDALHHDHRDGRPRRRAGVPGLRQDQHLRRLVRHPRRAGLHAPAWRSRPRRRSSTASRRPTCGCRCSSRATSQRALDLLVTDCEHDDGCRKAYPNLAERMRALMAAAGEGSADGAR